MLDRKGVVVSMTTRSRVRSGAESTVGTGELRRRLADPELAIVDVRALSAYNGWREGGEARGGHVPGAVALPQPWLDARRQRTSRHCWPRRGSSPSARSSSTEVAIRRRRPRRELSELEYAAYSDVQPRLVDLGVLSAPARGAARAATTSSSTRMASRSPRGRAPGSGTARADRPLPRQLRRPGGIRGRPHPGAGYLDTNWLENPHRLEPALPEELDASVRALGITTDTTVVLYGRDTEGEAEREVARSSRRPDRCITCSSHPPLLRRRRRPPPRRRLRPLGARGAPAGDGRANADAGLLLRRRHPAASGADRRHRGG